jgi:hypothetical protein
MAFSHTKNFYTESFIKARIRIQTSGSGSDQKGPDPTDPAPQTLVYAVQVQYRALIEPMFKSLDLLN